MVDPEIGRRLNFGLGGVRLPACGIALPPSLTSTAEDPDQNEYAARQEGDHRDQYHDYRR